LQQRCKIIIKGKEISFMAGEELIMSDPGVIKAAAAAIGLGIAAVGGTLGQGMAISRSVEAMARQPEVKNDIRATMLLGLVFIESIVLYALVIAFITLFVK
jgi:F-type H+-transporting ATPase subunit c